MKRGEKKLRSLLLLVGSFFFLISCQNLSLREPLQQGPVLEQDCLGPPALDLSSQKVSPPPVLEFGTSISIPLSEDDPDLGSVQDAWVQAFRQAMLFYQVGDSLNAQILFAELLEKEPDHPLAGSVQFYLAQLAWRQKKGEVALEGFQKLLASYPTTIHVSDALLQLSFISLQLQNLAQARHYGHLLSRFFPQSPAALSFRSSPSSEKILQGGSTQ